MSPRWFTLLPPLCYALCGCGGSGPLAPNTASPPPIPNYASAQPTQPVGGLGLFHVAIDADLGVELTFPRAAQEQGDVTRVSGRPYLGPNEISLASVERSIVAGTDAILLTLKVDHPFPLPVDLERPASTTKRIDLHVFKPILVVLKDGATAFTFADDAPVTDPSFLLNASGYIQPGGLLMLDGLTANTFPYRHITPLDAVSNYDPLDGGWQDAALLAPQGFGVFAQGSSHLVQLAIALPPNAAPQGLDLAVMGHYADPRATPDPKDNRLPDPEDPTRLRYVLPAGAGDNSAVTVEFPGGNEFPNGGGDLPLVVSIIDWDNASTVADPYPNGADLSQGPEASGTASVTALIPGVTTGPIEGIAIPGGDGTPDNPVQWEVTLTNSANQSTGGSYTGLVRVEDQQVGLHMLDLAEALDVDGRYHLDTPLPELVPTVTYQVFTVEIEAALCDQVVLGFRDQDGDNILDNGDQLSFVAVRDNQQVPATGWAIDPLYQGALNENPPPVSDIDLTNPYTSELSTGEIRNNTRSAITLTARYSVGHPAPLLACTPRILNISANDTPSCPNVVGMTDSAGGALDAGDLVTVSWDEIADNDNALDEITVSVALDLDGDTLPDETLEAPASDGTLTSTLPVAADAITATLTLSDNAGPVPSCTPLTLPATTPCDLLAFTLADQTGSATLHPGDQLRLTVTPQLDGSWSLDPDAFSDHLTGSTDLAPRTSAGEPIDFPLTTALITNDSRSEVSGAFLIPITAERNGVSAACVPVTGTIAGNIAPSCPSSVTLTDDSSGLLEGLDLIQVHFSGIVDPDSPADSITVHAAFDLDGDGTYDESVDGVASDESLTSLSPAAACGNVRVQLTIGDDAGTIAPCAPLTQATAIRSVGNISLRTLASPGSLREGIAAAQPLYGIRLSWAALTGIDAYGIYMASWPAGTALSDVTFAPLGEVTGGATSYDMPFNGTMAQGNRYAFRVNARCASGGPNGADSELAAIALQDFEGAAIAALDGAGPLANDWVTNYEDAGQTYLEVTGTSPLGGTRSLICKRLSINFIGDTIGYWATFSPPGMSAGDVASLGALEGSRFEFNHHTRGSWNPPGGMSVVTNSGRPSDLGATAGPGWLWIGATLSGQGYTDAGADDLDSEFGLFGQHDGASMCFGWPSGASTFSAFDGSPGLITTGHRYIFLAFADEYGEIANQVVDDIAWIVH